jgi:hypothetical protein
VSFVSSTGLRLVLTFLSLSTVGREHHTACFLPPDIDLDDYALQLLASYYFFTSTLHLIVRNTRLVFLSRLLSSVQFLVVPVLLFVALNIWSSPDAHATITKAADWTQWAFLHLPAWWEAILRISSPFFVILEGMYAPDILSFFYASSWSDDTSNSEQIYLARDPVYWTDSSVLHRRKGRIIRIPLSARFFYNLRRQRCFAIRCVGIRSARIGQRDSDRRLDH